MLCNFVTIDLYPHVHKPKAYSEARSLSVTERCSSSYMKHRQTSVKEVPMFQPALQSRPLPTTLVTAYIFSAIVI
jgi:hypothetical protein